MSSHIRQKAFIECIRGPESTKQVKHDPILRNLMVGLFICTWVNCLLTCGQNEWINE